MKLLSRTAAGLFALVVLAACASTEVTERQRYEGAKLARPDRIIVYDFTADPADVPPKSAFAAQMAGARAPAPQQISLGRKLGAQVAKELVADLSDTGAAGLASAAATSAVDAPTACPACESDASADATAVSNRCGSMRNSTSPCLTR